MTPTELRVVGAEELTRRLATQPDVPERDATPSESRRMLRDTAALRGWFQLEQLVRGTRAKHRVDDYSLTAFATDDCERVRTPRGVGAWRLRLGVRRNTIAALLGVSGAPARLLSTTAALELDADDTAGQMAVAYLGKQPPELRDLDRNELTAAITASTWVSGLTKRFPPTEQFRERLRQVALLAPLQAVADRGAHRA